MNSIYFGDNLVILRGMPNESVDLIYIDPPFNTGKTQKQTRIKTVRSENGDRKGFQGNTYNTIKIGSRSYKDSFDIISGETIDSELDKAYQLYAPHTSLYFIESFLKPRLTEAYRILKPHGSLYFHIDYRESHYCKILLDTLFGRDCFINEIIWAYDFGGKAKSKWPAKHDNILFYVKDPNKYIFNTGEIDRERYMAPGLVGQEKAEKGKLPTDTWFFPYVGKRPTDTWWQTIVPTNSKERRGYPTQKPRKLIDRIIKASSLPGSTVLDFFAGSGTVGESCLELQRYFILIDNNQAALEVMAQRFRGYKNIEWINYDPTPFQVVDNRQKESVYQDGGELSMFSREFESLAATASYLQKDLEEQSDLWKNSPFEWVLQLPARRKGKLGRYLVASWCASKGLYSDRPKDSSESLIINGYRFALKFSTLWTNGIYKFQQIREQGYDYILCFGISPSEAHCWIFDRKYVLSNASPQHKGTRGAEYWIQINPQAQDDWTKNYGGTLDQAYDILFNLKKK